MEFDTKMLVLFSLKTDWLHLSSFRISIKNFCKIEVIINLLLSSQIFYAEIIHFLVNLCQKAASFLSNITFFFDNTGIKISERVFLGA